MTTEGSVQSTDPSHIPEIDMTLGVRGAIMTSISGLSTKRATYTQNNHQIESENTRTHRRERSLGLSEH